MKCEVLSKYMNNSFFYQTYKLSTHIFVHAVE